MPTIHSLKTGHTSVYTKTERTTCSTSQEWSSVGRRHATIETLDFDRFDWDTTKARSNYEKHGITFEEAAEALSHPHLEEENDKHGEIRVLAICPLSGRVVAVVYTIRGAVCRIISARAARKNEQREYRLIFAS